MRQGLAGLAGYIWRYRGLVGLGLLAVIVSDAAQLVVPLVVQRAVNHLAGGTATGLQLRDDGLTLVGLAAVALGSKIAWRHFLFSASRSTEVDLRNRLLAKMLSLPAAQRSRIGEFLALASNDVDSIQYAVAFGLLAAIDSVGYTLATVSAMLWLDWRLTLWTVIPFPVLALVIALAMRQIYRRWDRVQSSFSDLTEKVRESIAGMRVLRAFVQREGDVRDFVTYNRAYRDRFMEYVRVDASFRPAILFLAGCATGILLLVGGDQVIHGQTSIGTFAAFTAYLAQLTWPMIAAGWMMILVQRGAASMSRFQNMLEMPEEPPGRAPDEAFLGGLEMRGLSFTYPGESAPALEGVDVRLEPGQSLGVLGEVGSGKSTLVQLLARLYDPPLGTVFLDGQDVLELDLDAVRSAVALVPQEAFLFSETIEGNLRLARPDAADAEIREAARQAAIHREVMEFPDAYQTLLGERGISLSGGQKQRLCLARALLKQAPILVFDDTLSAVDHDTEHRILEHLRERPTRQTRIVVSHRVSAVADLDTILVLSHGRPIQRGSHQELIEVPGFYRDLYRLQTLEDAIVG